VPDASPTPPNTGEKASRADRRQDVVKNSRQARKKQYEKNRREMLIIKIASGILVAGLLLAIGYGTVNFIRDRELNRPPEGVKSYTYVNNNHLEGDIDYSAQADYQGEIPPSGGAHNTTPQQCQVYTAQIRTENALHSLEHGAVWITYQPSLPAADIAKIAAIADGDNYILVSPYDGLPAPIVLSAWGKQLQMQSFDKDTIERFLRAYKNTPSNTPEFGASCAGTTATK